MARSFYLYLMFFIFICYNVKMIILTNEYDLLKRHLGSARENRYRARQRASNNNIPQPLQQPSLLSPDFLRARWIELYNENNNNNNQT